MEGDPAPLLPDLWILGAGKVGLALGLLLRRSGAVGRLTVSGRGPAPPEHPLFGNGADDAEYLPLPALPDPAPTAVVIAVPDAEVSSVADRLASVGLPEGTAVLHTSGALGSAALGPLPAVGCSAGSLHPLVSIADPIAGAEGLRGAWFALEGEGGAREVGERIVRAAGGRLLPVAEGAKPLYHAAAVVASNYVVTLLDAAERIADGAGIPPEEGRAALCARAAGAIENVAAAGPAAALTGPVSRGDALTVGLHLERLSGGDLALYSVLARETLALARRRGLEPAVADELDDLLGDHS